MSTWLEDVYATEKVSNGDLQHWEHHLRLLWAALREQTRYITHFQSVLSDPGVMGLDFKGTILCVCTLGVFLKMEQVPR